MLSYVVGVQPAHYVSIIIVLLYTMEKKYICLSLQDGSVSVMVCVPLFVWRFFLELSVLSPLIQILIALHQRENAKLLVSEIARVDPRALFVFVRFMARCTHPSFGVGGEE